MRTASIDTTEEARAAMQAGATVFDYDHQCWIADRCVQRCGHPDGMDCSCYGREHSGQSSNAHVGCEVH